MYESTLCPIPNRGLIPNVEYYINEKLNLHRWRSEYKSMLMTQMNVKSTQGLQLYLILYIKDFL